MTADVMIRHTLLFVTLAAVGCLGSAFPDDNNGGAGTQAGGSNGGAGAVAGDMGADATAAFNASVAPIVRAACAGCHGANGTAPGSSFRRLPTF